MATTTATNEDAGDMEGASAATATHMLLYLDRRTFLDAAGERLAAEVRALRAANLPIVLLHDKDSCEFGLFFTSTPQDLIDSGLYKTVALELLPPPHDQVSAVHFAKAVGDAVARRSRVQTDRSKSLRKRTRWRLNRKPQEQAAAHLAVAVRVPPSRHDSSC